MENKVYEYVISVDGLGCVELFKVEEDDIDNLLEELEASGKIFSVVTSPTIENDTLCIEAELWEKGEE
jgi:hypothetical protein